MFSMVVVLVLAANCESTSQCEDGLVCETGRCVTPAAPTVTPPPLVSEPVSESDASKVYRLNGQLCRDVTDANGVTQHECVSETPPARKAPPIRPPPTEEERRRSMAPIGPPPLDLAFNVFAHGGFASIAQGRNDATFGVVGFSTSVSLVHHRSGIGLGALLSTHFSTLPTGVAHLWTAGPVVRFGRTHHVSAGLMICTSFLPVTATEIGATITPAVAVEAAAEFGHLTLAIQPILRMSPPGVVFTLTAGVGFAL